MSSDNGSSPDGAGTAGFIGVTGSGDGIEAAGGGVIAGAPPGLWEIK